MKQFVRNRTRSARLLRGGHSVYTGRIYFCTRHTGRVLSIACTQRDALCTRSFATRSTTFAGDLVRDSAKGNEREKESERVSISFRALPPRVTSIRLIFTEQLCTLLGYQYSRASRYPRSWVEWISIVPTDDIYHFLLLALFSLYFKFIEKYSRENVNFFLLNLRNLRDLLNLVKLMNLGRSRFLTWRTFSNSDYLKIYILYKGIFVN